jgi:hypothetical protein
VRRSRYHRAGLRQRSAPLGRKKGLIGGNFVSRASSGTLPGYLYCVSGIGSWDRSICCAYAGISRAATPRHTVTIKTRSSFLFVIIRLSQGSCGRSSVHWIFLRIDREASRNRTSRLGYRSIGVWSHIDSGSGPIQTKITFAYKRPSNLVRKSCHREIRSDTDAVSTRVCLFSAYVPSSTHNCRLLRDSTDS